MKAMGDGHKDGPPPNPLPLNIQKGIGYFFVAFEVGEFFNKKTPFNE